MASNYYNQGGYPNSNQPRDNQAPYQPNYDQGGYYASNNPPQQTYPQQNDYAYSAQGYGQQGNYQNQRYGGGYPTGNNYQPVNNQPQEAYYPAYEEVRVNEGFSAGRPVRLSQKARWLMMALAIIFLIVAIYLFVQY